MALRFLCVQTADEGVRNLAMGLDRIFEGLIWHSSFTVKILLCTISVAGKVLAPGGRPLVNFFLSLDSRSSSSCHLIL